MSKPVCIAAALVLLSAVSPVSGQVITFQGFVPPGGLVNISPTAPYTESGFQFTPSNGSSAVFSASGLSTMTGNPSDWFGFAETNVITMAPVVPTPFDLTSILVGRTSITTLPQTTVTVVGNLNGGGTLSLSFPGLTTATLETLNWSNLSSVVFTCTDDCGLDNINLSPVPEPSALMLLSMAAALAYRRVRRHHGFSSLTN